VFSEEDFNKFKYPKLYRYNIFRWIPFRCPEAGIAHLEWEMSLEDESEEQRNSAKTIYDLYNWWKVKRPQREDPYDISGYNSLKVDEVNWLDESNPEYKEIVYKKVLEGSKIEDSYYKEDSEMLKLLIDVRRSLWT
jgi:hypothetical protein